ncbi:hypothetical protein CTheo_3276 [Ceratobasidium theobromae]|uniref:Uncharacterized protein n=1 Tax=Ceratobasidium theobromae TaxID=1582974 RepID=A0A5N5QNY4_9AGAM|nr:hypothetical protein CTheo_3276 [Ceratobasidium theobromae]
MGRLKYSVVQNSISRDEPAPDSSGQVTPGGGAAISRSSLDRVEVDAIPSTNVVALLEDPPIVAEYESDQGDFEVVDVDTTAWSEAGQARGINLANGSGGASKT